MSANPLNITPREAALARADALSQGLYPHQVEGVAFLLGRHRAILADDMGLGKTRQAVLALTEARPEGPWLVVCPASVKQSWAREIRAVLPDAEVQVIYGGDAPAPDFSGWVVVNYALLTRNLAALKRLCTLGFVFDEAHYLKNHTSKRSKNARDLVDAAGKDVTVYALTGTPLTNRPRDLFPLLQLVQHPIARSFVGFAKRYCEASHNGYGWVSDGASNLDELSVQLHGVMLRRTKDEVLDLPPKVRSWRPVTIRDGVGRASTRKAFGLLLAGSRQARGVDASGRTGGAVGADRGKLLAALTTARRQIAVAKVKTTAEFVEGILDQGEKVIVFSSFTEPIEKLAAHFGDAALTLTGSTPAEKRQAVVDAFQTDPEKTVLFANLIAGGVGITLTAARQVVFNDLDWVPTNHWQAEDRAYRIGQTGAVHVHYLVAEGTVEAFVQTVLETKSALIEAVVDGGALKGTFGEDALSTLERIVGAISPKLAQFSPNEIDEDLVDRLLREATQAARAERQREQTRRVEVSAAGLPPALVALLAQALGGPRQEVYTVTSNSVRGLTYQLEVHGPDVTCDCPGFGYRARCSHATRLKAALERGGDPPAGYARAT